MKKSDLLRAIQSEIQRHNLPTFMSEKDKIVLMGCSTCRKHFGTVEHPLIMTEPLNAVEIPKSQTARHGVKWETP
jgi:hypothetical protein